MLFKLYGTVFREEASEDGSDLPSAEPTQDDDAQKIIDEINGEQKKEEDVVDLPSDKADDGEDTLFADKYKSVDELKAGIAGLKSNLPDYVIAGMSNEALEQHYVELRKNFSGKKPNGDRKFQEDEKPPEEKPDEKKEEKKANTANLWKDLESDFKSSGKITNDMYDKFEEMGIPSSVVDGYADNMHKEQVSFTKSVYEIAGGEEEFKALKDWSEDGNISPAELKAIEGMPYEAMLGAIHGIKARYDLAKGESTTISKRITGDTNRNSGGSYTNQNDYMKDIADKRYGQNRQYTEAVELKFKNSKFK